MQRFGTPGMAINLWGASPLYENEGLKVGSIPTVTPIEKVLEACGHRPKVGRRKGDRPWGGSNVSKLRGYGQKLATNATRRCPGRCGPVSEPTGHRRAALVRNRLRSSALVNRELVQRKLVVLSRESWSPCPELGLPNSGAVRCKPPGDSSSQQRP